MEIQPPLISLLHTILILWFNLLRGMVIQLPRQYNVIAVRVVILHRKCAVIVMDPSRSPWVWKQSSVLNDMRCEYDSVQKRFMEVGSC